MTITISAVAAAAGAVEARRIATARKADAAFQAYAAATQMTYVPARIGWAHTRWPRIDGQIAGVAVSIEVGAHLTELDYHTIVTAAPAALRTGSVDLAREGVTSTLAKLFGAQDLVVGDAAFDKAFVIRATDVETARAVLSAETRSDLLAIEAARFVIDDGTATDHTPMVLVELPGVVGDSERLHRALAIVTRVARPNG